MARGSSTVKAAGRGKALERERVVSALSSDACAIRLNKLQQAKGRQAHLGVSLLGLLGVAGEEDEAVLVRLQAVGVELERLLGSVAPAVVDGNADGERLLPRHAGGLELLKGEASALSQATVVAESGAADGGTEELGRSDTGAGGLALASDPSRLLAAGLVEPGLDPALPVLPEVIPMKDVVAAETL
jgi:hypothetical protein